MRERGWVVHYEEIALKGKNRDRFEEALVRNLLDRLGGGARARRLPGRILLLPRSSAPPDALSRVARLPGVAHVAEAAILPIDWAALETEAIARMTARAPFATFAVRAVRQDKALPFTSRDAEIRLGAAVQKATGAAVNLSRPEATLHVEFLSRRAILSVGRVPGPGGLPVGTSGDVLCLLSGGIDSPAASYLMMTRGCRVHFVHFHSFPFTRDRNSVDKCRRIAARLAEIQGPATLWTVPIGEVQQALATAAPPAYRTLLFKTLMLRAASGLAAARGFGALVTGDSLGQVASQTLRNLAAVSRDLPLPLLQPLVGLGKREITRIAERIGTYPISIETQEDCCRFLEPRQAETRADPDVFTRAAREADIDAHVRALLARWPEPEPAAPAARAGTTAR